MQRIAILLVIVVVIAQVAKTERTHKCRSDQDCQRFGDVCFHGDCVDGGIECSSSSDCAEGKTCINGECLESWSWPISTECDTEFGTLRAKLCCDFKWKSNDTVATDMATVSKSKRSTMKKIGRWFADHCNFKPLQMLKGYLTYACEIGIWSFAECKIKIKETEACCETDLIGEIMDSKNKVVKTVGKASKAIRKGAKAGIEGAKAVGKGAKNVFKKGTDAIRSWIPNSVKSKQYKEEGQETAV